MTDFKENVLAHLKKYPRLEIEDVFKFIYQGAFGCEHMVSSIDNVTEKIENEYSDGDLAPTLVERLSDKYCRVHLSFISKGLSVSTLGKLFFQSAKREENGEKILIEMLNITKELVFTGVLPFSYDEFLKKANDWKEKGYPPLHHSQPFKDLYNPKYRVISTEYLIFLPLLAKIDSLLGKGRLTLAIEGGSASGKTTLASLLTNLYDPTVFHMDDFFLTPKMRTAERLNEVGGNVDRERFLDEVLIPLSKNQSILYRAFDCSSGGFKKAVTISPKNLIIIEGVYSMHPDLAKYYGLSVFLDIDKEKQRARILKRNAKELAPRFFNEWIPYENNYFEKTDIKNRCDLVIKV